MFICENAKFIRIDISSDFLDLFLNGPIIFVQSNIPVSVISRKPFAKNSKLVELFICFQNFTLAEKSSHLTSQNQTLMLKKGWGSGNYKTLNFHHNGLGSKLLC